MLRKRARIVVCSPISTQKKNPLDLVREKHAVLVSVVSLGFVGNSGGRTRGAFDKSPVKVICNQLDRGALPADKTKHNRPTSSLVANCFNPQKLKHAQKNPPTIVGGLQDQSRALLADYFANTFLWRFA